MYNKTLYASVHVKVNELHETADTEVAKHHQKYDFLYQMFLLTWLDDVEIN